MNSMGLVCRTVKKFKVTTNSKHHEPVTPNLLNGEFTVEKPNKFRLVISHI